MHTFTNIHSFSRCPDTHARAYHSLIHTVTCPHSYTLSQLCIDASTLIYNTTAPPMHSHPHAHVHLPDTFTPADSVQTPLPLPHTHRQVQMYFLHPYSDTRVHTAPEDSLHHHVCTYKPRHSDTQTHILYIYPPHTHSCTHIYVLSFTRTSPCTYTYTSPTHVAALHLCWHQHRPYPVPRLIFHTHTFTHIHASLTQAYM